MWNYFLWVDVAKKIIIILTLPDLISSVNDAKPIVEKTIAKSLSVSDLADPRSGGEEKTSKLKRTRSFQRFVSYSLQILSHLNFLLEEGKQMEGANLTL